MPDELDSRRVHDIVLDVFQRRGVPPPYSIEFERRETADKRSRVYLEEKTLHVSASSEPELRRSIGRFVVRHTWTPHDWFLMTHPGLYIPTVIVLLATLPAISFLVAYMLPEFRFWIVVATTAAIIVFSLWTSFQVSRRSPRLLRDFTITMADLECMTEYDSEDYMGDSHLISIGGIFICASGALASAILSLTFYSQEFVLVALSFLVLLPAALCVLFSQAWTSIGSNLCYQTEESEEDEEMEIDKFEGNEYLQGVFESLIERMNLRKSLTSWHREEFGKVRARFSKTRYAQCRGVYHYVEKGTLFMDIEDLSEAAARRYGASVLARASLPFYNELSLKRRAVHAIALIFGVIMILVALAIGIEVSVEAGIGTLLFTCILFIGMWYMGWKQNKEVRRDLPDALRKTGVLKEYEVDLYCNRVFPISSGFELRLLIGFLISVIIAGVFILAISSL